MKIYMAGGMVNTTKNIASNPSKQPLARTNFESVDDYIAKTPISKQVQLNSSNMVGLGLANCDALQRLNIKKKKSKNIAFEL
jgi:hypothetical protein